MTSQNITFTLQGRRYGTRSSTRQAAEVEIASDAAPTDRAEEAEAPILKSPRKRAKKAVLPVEEEESTAEDQAQPAAAPGSSHGTAVPLATFSDLPNEIIHDCLMRLRSPLSVLNASLTCRRLYKYMDDQFFKTYVDQHYQMSTAVASRARNIVIHKLQHSMCEVCEELGGDLKQCTILNKNACETCGAHIAVTRAKSEYKVNEKEIAHLQFISRPNPHYRSAAPMRLYSEIQVKQVSTAKYAAKNTTLAAHKAKKAASPRKDVKANRQTRLDAALAAVGASTSDAYMECSDYVRTGRGDMNMLVSAVAAKSQRKQALEAALEAQGLELRDDSKLCEQYIDDGMGDIPSIVATMDHMHVAFEHSITEILRQRSRDKLWTQHGLDGGPDRTCSLGHENWYDKKAEFYDAWYGETSACDSEAIELFERAVAAGATGKVCACGRPRLARYIRDNLEDLRHA